ncbi:hypothetical protein [Thiolapillus brandeum]|uniref:DUF5658 domain-containing protein n=1 Tax=Thiolapillus brandeum TaxID=1076588 RepID=A0A7U6GH42_9GAMM|nr:hypothetical protein [Thiolapillus brandeum]BAO43534.1 hypothetical protein TBH_C0590 [Thiolapillus brandeum]
MMRILGEEIDPKANIRAAYLAHRVLWGVLLISILLDFFTTLQFMLRDGVQHEGNAVVRWLVQVLGVVPGILVGKLLQLIAVLGLTALSYRMAPAVVIVVVFSNCLAVLMNLY